MCFLDPEALELSWSTVRQVAQTPGRNRKPELLILFTLPMGPQRMLTTRGPIDHASEAALDQYFPDRGWWDVYQDYLARNITAAEARSQYIDIYKGGLRTLGYEEDGIFSLPVKTLGQPGGKGRLLYHLVAASDHPAGKRIMKHVLERHNSLDSLAMGQLSLLEE
jgi:three-Cys-motif partner protein